MIYLLMICVRISLIYVLNPLLPGRIIEKHLRSGATIIVNAQAGVIHGRAMPDIRNLLQEVSGKYSWF